MRHSNEQHVCIICQLEAGAAVAYIAHKFGVNERLTQLLRKGLLQINPVLDGPA